MHGVPPCGSIPLLHMAEIRREILELSKPEWGKGAIYMLLIRRRGGKHMQICKWEFNSKFHHWVSTYILNWRVAENFFKFLCLQVRCALGRENSHFCVFCFWTNQCIARSLCFSELIFLLTLWHLPRARVKWDACHVHCHKIWLLSSSQLCPSSVNTRSCPAFRVSNSKYSALTVVLHIYSDHMRLLIV